jgi:hypothetical protein
MLANAINGANLVVGESYCDTFADLAVVFNNGALTALDPPKRGLTGTFVVSGSAAYGVNDAGQMVGSVEACCSPFQRHPWL